MLVRGLSEGSGTTRHPVASDQNRDQYSAVPHPRVETMSNKMTKIALAAVAVAFGYVLNMQSYDMVSELMGGYPEFAAEYGFTLLLASIGLWSLTEKAGKSVGIRPAGLVVMMAGLFGFAIASVLHGLPSACMHG